MEGIEIETFDDETLDDNLDSYRQLHERSLWRRFETELQEDIDDEAFDELRPWEVAFEIGEKEATDEGFMLDEGF